MPETCTSTSAGAGTGVSTKIALPVQPVSCTSTGGTCTWRQPDENSVFDSNQRVKIGLRIKPAVDFGRFLELYKNVDL